MRRARSSWRAPVATIVAVVAVGTLASARPSLRPPRGPQEAAAGATGTPGVSGAVGKPGSSIDPAAETGAEKRPDFSACKDLTRLDDAVCSLEALLEIHPANKGLQIALDHLQGNDGKHGGGPSDQPPAGDGPGDAVGDSTHDH